MRRNVRHNKKTIYIYTFVFFVYVKFAHQQKEKRTAALNTFYIYADVITKKNNIMAGNKKICTSVMKTDTAAITKINITRDKILISAISTCFQRVGDFY